MKTFTSHNGRRVTANTPAEAMLKLWGPPRRLRLPIPHTETKPRYTTIGHNGYSGLGLSEESTR